MDASSCRVAGRRSKGVFNESLYISEVYVNIGMKRMLASFGSGMSYSGSNANFHFGVFGIRALVCKTTGSPLVLPGPSYSVHAGRLVPALVTVAGHTVAPFGRANSGMFAEGLTE